MVLKCIVKGCNNSHQTMKMHVFPKLPERFEIWARAIGRSDLSLKNVKMYRICDIHFSQKQKFEANRNRSNLKAQSVPDIHLPQLEDNGNISVSALEDSNPGLSTELSIPCYEEKSHHYGEKRTGSPVTPQQSKVAKKSQSQNTPELAEELNVIREMCSTMITENSTLKNKVSELNNTMSRFTEECEESKQLSEQNRKLNKEKKMLSASHSKLTISNLQLKQEHEDLLKSHNALKADLNKKLLENEELHLNLTLASKEIIDLRKENTSLKRSLNNTEILRSKLYNIIQDMKGNVRVLCRVRPPIQSEQDHPQCEIRLIDEGTIEIRKQEGISARTGRPFYATLEFTVDKIFEPKSSQQDIFKELSQLVQSALDGYNICVFAFGQTGSGKTYTMQGEESPEKKGMIPRTVDLIFESITDLKAAGWNYEISASFLELYNENVRDLLIPNSSQNIEIHYNEDQGTTVTNLLIEKFNSADEFETLLTVAQRNRTGAATNFNEYSSRSHIVTKIYLKGINQMINVSYTGSINLVDLAGSECIKTKPNVLLPKTNVNRSLATLKYLMAGIYVGEKHIPYKNSKLTSLLQSCLAENSKTLMIVNIVPFEECYADTIDSLAFATSVKQYAMRAKIRHR